MTSHNACCITLRGLTLSSMADDSTNGSVTDLPIATYLFPSGTPELVPELAPQPPVFACAEPGCGRTFDSANGLGVHRGRAHWAGREDADVVLAYPCADTDCDRSFSTAQALAVHRWRAHGTEEQKAQWSERNMAGRARKRELAQQMAAALDLESQPPEVLAELDRRRTNPSGAWRKRKARAKAAGQTDTEFLTREIELIHAMLARRAAGIRGPGRPPRRPNETTALAVVNELTRREAASFVGQPSERTIADDLFARVGDATRALFPVVPHDRIIEIAEWQTLTLRMMQR